MLLKHSYFVDGNRRRNNMLKTTEKPFLNSITWWKHEFSYFTECIARTDLDYNGVLGVAQQPGFSFGWGAQPHSAFFHSLPFHPSLPSHPIFCSSYKDAPIVYGPRSFAVAGPSTWNSLPAPLRSCHLTSTFRRDLKTELFIRAYH